MPIVNDPSQGNLTSSDTDWRAGLDLSGLDDDLSEKPKVNPTDWRKNLNIDSLNKELLGVDSSKASKSNGAYTGANLGPLRGSDEINDLSKSDKSSSSDPFSYLKPEALVSGVKGAAQGAKDVLSTLGSGIGYIDSKLSDAGAKRYEAWKADQERQKAQLPTDDTAFDVGRVAGQVLATTPLLPVRAMEAVYAAGKALPYVGRVVAPAISGALGGATFGAATNSANDAGLPSNVATGALTGAVAGPVAEAGVGAANALVKGAGNVIKNARIANTLKNTDITPAAAKNTLSILDEQGLTPAQANAKLITMGPNATLADLSPGLTDEASGLAAMTGKQSNMLKTRYQDRASTADDAAHNIMETKLGPKPDLGTEKEAIHTAAQTATSVDYKLAHNSKQALDVQPIVDDIDKAMTNSVGETKTALTKAKSYFYTDNGNIKADVAPLHSVRQELDANLKKLERDGESQSPAYRALNDIRGKLDAQLKSNPEMAAADAKFAQHMDTKSGLDIGYKAISAKPNYDKFEREFANASLEKQDAIRKGLRAQIGDMMEAASRGELAGAQQLFAKKAANRKIMQLAFGNDGDQVLNALERQAALRSTERGVTSGSQTASRQAVRERYGIPAEDVRLRDIGMAGATDFALGSPGIITAATTAKRTFSHTLGRIGEAAREAKKVGTADLISRQSQHGRDIAADSLARVAKISSGNNFKLPVDNARFRGTVSNATVPAVSFAKSKLDRFRGISEQ